MRTPATERRLLRDIAESAGYMDAGEFFDQAQARMRKGEREYELTGRGFAHRSFSALVGEAMEEGVDFPNWLILAAQRLEADRERLPEGVADHIEQMLIASAADVLRGWYGAKMALELYHEFL